MINVLRQLLYFVGAVVGFLLLTSPALALLSVVLTPIVYIAGASPDQFMAQLNWFLLLLGPVGTAVILISDSLSNRSIEQFVSSGRRVVPSAALKDSFSKLKVRFDLPSAELHVLDSDEINAYALQSPSRQVVVVTRSLLDSFRAFWKESEAGSEGYRKSVDGVLAHELSHLKNGDYLPQWIYNGVARMSVWLQSFLLGVTGLLSTIIGLVPLIGPLFVLVLTSLGRAITAVVNVLFSHVLPRLIHFLDAPLSRAVEYRCDLQGARAVGDAGYLGMLSLASTLGVRNFRIHDDHPPGIQRVVRLYRRRDEFSEPRAPLLNPLSCLPQKLSLLFLLMLTMAAAWTSLEHLGWVGTDYSRPIVASTALAYHHLSVGVAPPGVARALSTIAPAVDPILAVFDRVAHLLDALYGQVDTWVSNSLPSELGPGGRALARLALLSISLWVSYVLLRELGRTCRVAVVLLRRAWFGDRRNHYEHTPLDTLLYPAVELNSQGDVLTLLNAGANVSGYSGAEKSPAELARELRRRRLALLLRAPRPIATRR